MPDTHPIYLDSAASSAVDPRVREAMLPWLGTQCGNPSSIHAWGREARVAIERARIEVAALADCSPADVLFTSGGTEADNMALLALLEQRAAGHVVTSRAEHPAVLAGCALLEEHGWSVTRLEVRADGSVGMEELTRALEKETALVALMHVNNETGGVTDIAEAARLAHARHARVHVDAVQSFGKLPLDFNAAGIDTAALSAHKIHGPKGAGALLRRRGTPVARLLYGGSQERGMRAGTENVPAIVGFGHAARLAREERESRAMLWRKLRDLARSILLDGLPGCIVNELTGSTVPSILSITLPPEHWPLEGDMLVPRLDLAGVAVSGGAACSSGSATASHVMRAIGHDDAAARASLRLSFGARSTEEEVRAGAERIVRIVREMAGKPY